MKSNRSFAKSPKDDNDEKANKARTKKKRPNRFLTKENERKSSEIDPGQSTASACRLTGKIQDQIQCFDKEERRELGNSQPGLANDQNTDQYETSNLRATPRAVK